MRVSAGCKKDRGWLQKGRQENCIFMGRPPRQGGRARLTGYITWKIVAKTCTFRNLQIVERYWVFLDARSIFHRQERFMKRRGINISGCVVLRGPLPAISRPWLAFVTAEEVTSCPPPGWSRPGCLFQRTFDKQNMALAQVLTGTVTELAEYICLLLIRASLTGDMLCVQKYNQSKN